MSVSLRVINPWSGADEKWYGAITATLLRVHLALCCNTGEMMDGSSVEARRCPSLESQGILS
jgi:hypothetical protein